MSSFQSKTAFALAVLLALAASAHAQKVGHIGYVYPAGGQQGSTFEAVIAGQTLAGAGNVYVSGGGVRAELVELVRPMSGKETNELRIQIDDLLARKAVVRNDFAALEQFRSFRPAKEKKDDEADKDKELDELKKRYAGAAWTPADEKLLLETRKKLSGGVRRPANPAISELAIVRVTVASDAQPGLRELRLATASGLSNPLAFHVGRLAEFSEEAAKAITEQKSAVARTAFAPKGRVAKPEIEITLPAVVNGQILPGEVDRFRFEAVKGQRLVVAASARRLIPYIADAVPGWFQATLALYDAAGNELAYADDFRFEPDPVLSCEIPADGRYVIEIKDSIYRGREDFVYRITIGETPFVTDVFPLGGPAGAAAIVELSGWNLPSDKLTVNAEGWTPGIRPLPLGKDQAISGRALFAVDTLAECLDHEANDDQEKAQKVASPVIVNGRTSSNVPITVYALRRDGFAGEIAVSIKDAPKGFALRGVAPGDKDQAQLTLTLPPSARDEPYRLHLEGRATIDGREVSRAAVPAEDMMQAFACQHLVPSQELTVLVQGRAKAPFVKRRR